MEKANKLLFFGLKFTKKLAEREEEYLERQGKIYTKVRELDKKIEGFENKKS